MIKIDRESPIICDTCNEPAIRREVYVQHPGEGGRFVVYDTHSNSLHEEEHTAIFNRIENFHAQLHSLEAELNRLSQENKKLEHGWIVKFEFDSVRPTACEVRTHVAPKAAIQAFGFSDEVKLDPQPLKGLSAKNILSRIKEASNSVIEKLKETRDKGDY